MINLDKRVFVPESSIPKINKKDYPVLVGSQELPHKYKPVDIENLLIEVDIDQGLSGSCVGQFIAKAISVLVYKQTQESYQFSPWWAWVNRPDGLHRLLKTEGTDPKAQSELVCRDGICFANQYWLDSSKEIKFDDVDNQFYDEVRDLYLDTAIEYKADMYLIPQTVEEVKTAIMEFGTVGIMIPVHSSFREAQLYGNIPIPDVDNEYLYGYHQMTLYGWDDELGIWYGSNSYGLNWGDKDLFTMPFAYPIRYFISLVDNTRIHWADRYFYMLWQKNIVIHDRDFGKDITRGESMAIIARVQAKGEENIPDLEGDHHWALKYFLYLNSKGLEIHEESFNDPITRGEFMTLLYKAMTGQILGKGPGHWAEVYYQGLKLIGVNIFDRRFDDKITRGESFALLARALPYKGW